GLQHVGTRPYNVRDPVRGNLVQPATVTNEPGRKRIQGMPFDTGVFRTLGHGACTAPIAESADAHLVAQIRQLERQLVQSTEPIIHQILARVLALADDHDTHQRLAFAKPHSNLRLSAATSSSRNRCSTSSLAFRPRLNQSSCVSDSICSKARRRSAGSPGALTHPAPSCTARSTPPQDVHNTGSP